MFSAKTQAQENWEHFFFDKATITVIDNIFPHKKTRVEALRDFKGDIKVY